MIDEEEPETDYNVVKTAKPKKATKKPRAKAKSTKAKNTKAKKKKKEELPDAKDLIKDLEDELFGKNKGD